MNILEINDIKIDSGAPEPKILSSDNELFVIFYSSEDGDSFEQNDFDSQSVTVIRFEGVLSYKFGMPNDETFTGHPLYKYGLKLYAAQLIEGSSWVNEIKKIDSVHPYHNAEKFLALNHYLLSFKDNTFECISQGYETTNSNKSMYDVSVEVLRNLFE